MTFEEQEKKLVDEMSLLINDIIPTSWANFSFNGAVKDAKLEYVYFYYQVPGDMENLHFCEYIPERFGVDREMFEYLMAVLCDLLMCLHALFEENEEELWYSCSIIAEFDGDLELFYDYVDWSLSEFTPEERVRYFFYQVHGVIADGTNSETINAMIAYEQAAYKQKKE